MRVVVVGAGIAGASAAFHLTQFGADVCLVESNAPGRATLAGAFAAVRYYPELVATLADLGESGVDYDVVGGLVVGHSAEQLDPVVRRLQRHLERGIKEIGEFRLLATGGPKELFPYLDSELAGVYLSGAARVSERVSGLAS
jgi:D-amino-acid dehydrogenase